MSSSQYRANFLLVFIGIVLALNLVIFYSYLPILFFALIFAVVSKPLYLFLKNFFGGRGTIAALITSFVVLVLILGPLLFSMSLLFNEASDLYQNIVYSNGGANFIQSLTSSVEGTLSNLLPLEDQSFSFDVKAVLTQGLSWILDRFSIVVSSFVKITFSMIVLLIGIFYFLRDGHKFKKSLIELSPLSSEINKLILEKIGIAIRSVFFGNIVVALIQGIFVGIGFSIFGVPSPALWGFVAVLASLVPVIGTGAVTLPVVLYLFISGQLPQALGVLLWAVLAVGVVDDLIRPQFIKRGGIKIHPFLILVSVLGGLSVFGLVGFVAGPVALSLFFTLLDVYRVTNKPKRISRKVSRSK